MIDVWSEWPKIIELELFLTAGPTINENFQSGITMKQINQKMNIYNNNTRKAIAYIKV